MNYAIMTLGNPERKHYVDAMENILKAGKWTRHYPVVCNGNDPEDLASHVDMWHLDINFPLAQKGHLGIWYSVLNTLHKMHYSKIDRLITFEDDALLNTDLIYEWDVRSQSIPDDADFFSLFLPRDQDSVYYGDVERYYVNDHVCKVYQRYGGVSMMYTRKGAKKIMELLEQEGITGQYDDSLYMWAKAGLLNGYTSPPNLSDLVYITGEEPSIVQNTDLYIGE